jgi:inorganic pyrophosphatase
MGSRHPEQGFIYPLNYGYIAGIDAPDGEDLDAYVLGVFEPIEEFTGKCIAVIHRTDEEDDKLVVVPAEVSYSDEQIEALMEFQERAHYSIIIR